MSKKHAVVPMDIENVKAVIESVKKKMKVEYAVTPHVSKILDDTCDTIIQQLETTDSLWKAQFQHENTFAE